MTLHIFSFSHPTLQVFSFDINMDRIVKKKLIPDVLAAVVAMAYNLVILN